jgi:hypothetical protein
MQEVRVQKQRLLKLAEFLRTKITDSQFDMFDWAYGRGGCMTAGCALGWATVCFPNSGLRLVDQGYDDEKDIENFTVWYDSNYEVAIGMGPPKRFLG